MISDKYIAEQRLEYERTLNRLNMSPLAKSLWLQRFDMMFLSIQQKLERWKREHPE